MIGKLLTGGAAVLALMLGAGQALAQQASADGSTGRPIAPPARAAEATSVAAASAGPERKARPRGRSARGNVVTKTLGGVPGLVGGTVGPALGQGASTIGGTVGGALGVGRAKPDETPSRP